MILSMKKIFISSLILALSLVGCRQEQTNLSTDNSSLSAEAQSDKGIKAGIIRVKLTSDLGDALSIESTSTGLRSGNINMDTYLQQIGARSMTRVFPHAGKYEARTRKKGLHLWYDIEFDERISTMRAAKSLEEIPGVSIVEKLYNVELPRTTSRVISLRNTTSDATVPFDDPVLPYQWHYNNSGKDARHISGADINLFKAWEVETGKPNVIVAIVDGGIDTGHVDLVENLYINSSEQGGSENADDDDNGYTDDIHGYNFVSKTGIITAHKHGTHVAGTVGARNNNKIGVSGVAGGNGTAESGIRMISCQIFEHATTAGDPDKGADGAPAIKYGADAGAVISQNSWGYQYPGPGQISASMVAAIEYFIEYAGCDEQGNQRSDSPMKGGVVIFAAGNDYMDYRAYPAAYPSVISVGAFGPDFKITDYSNRGDWVSILAPGGNDWLVNGEVLSTFPKNQYSFMAGTSMACPHVSGIAALIVSKYGKQGFTADELKSRLLNSLKDRNVNEENPSYKGRVGRGYIDAYRALMPKGSKRPENITDLKVVENLTGLQIAFAAVADEDDETASSYRLYASTEPLTTANFNTAPTQREIYAHFAKAGDQITQTLTGLEIDTKYYFAIVAEDRWGLTSQPYLFSGKTGINNIPVLEWSANDPIRITGNQTYTRTLNVKELDGQSWEFVVSGEQRGVLVQRDDTGNLLVQLRPALPAGTYRTTIKVVDIYGASAQTDLVFVVYDNTRPEASVSLPQLFIPLNAGERKVTLSDYYRDPEGGKLTYSARTLSNAAGVSVSVNEEVLTIKPTKLGISTVEIVAQDVQGAIRRGVLTVQCVQNDLIYRVYPIPATTELNLDLLQPTGVAKVEVRDSNGSKVIDKIYPATTAGALAVKLDITSLSPGSYILYVDIDGKKNSQPFVKI